MYFPYLYGRRAEIMAVRDLAIDLRQWNAVTPVIEPVKRDHQVLQRCLQQLVAVGSPIYVITNPTLDQFETEEVRQDWFFRLQEEFRSPLVMPTILIHGENGLEELEAFLEANQGRNVGVVLRTAQISPQDLFHATEGRSAVVFIHETANPKAYLRHLPDRMVVPVENQFNAQVRNADYQGSEWFTSSHQEFIDSERPGFSDFGPFPAQYQPGGGPAHAVAIHLTYEHEDGSIWIQHFVSDSRIRGDGTNTSKMAEATAHVFQAVEQSPGKFVMSDGLEAYREQHETGNTTSLESNKRQQLMHHIALCATMLTR